MARPMTVESAARRVAQVRAGQTTIEEAPAPSPLEQLAQIDALLASPTPEGYSRIVRESGWAEIVKSRLVELEEKVQVLWARIEKGERMRDELHGANPLDPRVDTWYDAIQKLRNEHDDAAEAHRNLLWQYERQLGRAS